MLLSKLLRNDKIHDVSNSDVIMIPFSFSCNQGLHLGPENDLINSSGMYTVNNLQIQ